MITFSVATATITSMEAPAMTRSLVMATIGLVYPNSDPSGQTDTRTLVNAYDPNGNLVMTELDSDGVALSHTEYRYDDLNRPIEEEHFDISSHPAASAVPYSGITPYNETKSHYDLDGNLASFADEAGRITRYQYDAINRPTDVTHVDPNGMTVLAHTHTVYDAFGNITSSTVIFDGIAGGTENQNRTTSYRYDRLNQHTVSIDPLGQSTTVNYDSRGNVIATVDPLGNTTRYDYDNLDRQTVVHDPLDTTANPVTTVTTYDEAGNVTSVTDPDHNVTTYYYDPRNQLIAESKSGLLTDLGTPVAPTSYFYDARGLLTASIDLNGQATWFYYDAFGRLIEKDFNGGIAAYGVQRYEYSADDLITNAFDTSVSESDPGSRTEYTYNYDDPLRRLSTTQISLDMESASVATTLVYHYNSGNDLYQIDIQSPSVDEYSLQYAYDGLGQEEHVIQSGDSVPAENARFTYDAAGELLTITRYASDHDSSLVATSAYAYDNGGRLSSLTHTGPGSTNLGSYTYSEYDADNRIKSEQYVFGTQPAELNTYAYDADGQLINATHSNQNTEAYQYDGNGNRNLSTSGVGSGSYAIGVQNELTSKGSTTFGYDNNGNLISADGTNSHQSLTYDGINRLRLVTDTDVDGNQTSQSLYSYDVFDRRVAKAVDTIDNQGQENTDATFYIYRGNILLLTVDGNGNVTHRFLSGPLPNQVLADNQATPSDQTGSTHWLFADEQQSVRVVAQYNGTTTTAENQITYDSFGNITAGITPAFGYAGMQYDSETGLYYDNARYYDPHVGHFITTDPANSGPNPYEYADNSPTNETDPSGLLAAGDAPVRVYPPPADYQFGWQPVVDTSAGYNPNGGTFTWRIDAQGFDNGWYYLDTGEPDRVSVAYLHGLGFTFAQPTSGRGGSGSGGSSGQGQGGSPAPTTPPVTITNSELSRVIAITDLLQSASDFLSSFLNELNPLSLGVFDAFGTNKGGVLGGADQLTTNSFSPQMINGSRRCKIPPDYNKQLSMLLNEVLCIIQ